MKLQIFVVRDVATEQFGNPMFLVSKGQAIRSFGDEVNNTESQNLLHKHPNDYELYELGSFNTDNGLFETHTPEKIASGKDLKLKA